MRPALEYASSIWSPLACSTSIKKLQVMQNAALITATGCTQDTYNRQTESTTIYNGLLPEALNELYMKKNNIHHFPTRNCDKYNIQTSTDIFSNVSARIWNVITTNIDVNISFMQFKIV